MHFNIIQISPNRVSKEDRIDEFSICKDPLVDMETEYAGDRKKYSNVIGTIKEELRPFATVNIRCRTIRFRSRQAVERKLQKAVNATVRTFKENMKNKAYWTAETKLRHGVTEPFDIDDLFYNGYCQKFSQVIADYLADSRNNYRGDDKAAFMANGYNHFIDSATRIAWATIFKQIGLGKYMTSGLQETLNRFQQDQSSLAITKENINKLFQFIMLNVGDIMDRSVVEVYDKFTRYFSGNTSYKEGWKTNKQFSCNRKVILPDVAEAGYMPQRYGYNRFFRSSYHHNLDDIDKAMCWLSGTNFDELTGEIDIPGQGKTACPARSTIEQTLRRIPVGSTDWHESAFFRVKAFKKGTIHIEFKDEALWAKFNLTVNKGKNKLGMAE